MIAYLKGKILHKNEVFLILEVNGLGYKILAVPDLLSSPIGAEIEVFTYHKSTDQEQALYGMPDARSLEFFELLLTVSGVGPKSALTIVSSAKIETLQTAIANQDLGMFTKMGGVGKKTAERIILELKTKVGVLGIGTSGSTDLFEALMGLGYNQREVRAAVEQVPVSASLEDQIKQALKIVGNKSS
ncbi:MAG TPA: Holliday junction branch migration protein RuvA [Patescibacteria group bacterium]|nr:Holliday junction branch migration protein RuvA [Patescibacteria group bacterium]